MHQYARPMCQEDQVLNKATRWVVDQLVPFETFNNTAFHDLLAEFNPFDMVPCAKMVKDHANLLHVDAKKKVRAKIKG